jgi:hypothetical protein
MVQSHPTSTSKIEERKREGNSEGGSHGTTFLDVADILAVKVEINFRSKGIFTRQ